MLKTARKKKAASAPKRKATAAWPNAPDPRPCIEIPGPDQDWLPQMRALNDVVGASSASARRCRDFGGVLTRHTRSAPRICTPSPRSRPTPSRTALRGAGPMVALAHERIEAAELIEEYIDYHDARRRSVHLPMPFVRHYLQRHDGALPTVGAIATLPIVLPDATCLIGARRSRSRPRHHFVIPKELREILPGAKAAPEAVRDAMHFLCDEWLCDVATDYAGKCTLIAAALTMIERSLLPDRPAFFVTAGRRGGGKTTTLTMLIMATTGIWPAAAAWSTNEEERRKALLSYFLSGVGYIIWDNITRGTQISCPHIEKSCTAAYYSDRKLGFSEMVVDRRRRPSISSPATISGPVAISPREAYRSASRSIAPDPENREFKHPDPIGWTEDNRAEILAALYTILLGNPVLGKPRSAAGRNPLQDLVAPDRVGGRERREARQSRGDHRLPEAFPDPGGRRRRGRLARRCAHRHAATMADIQGQ